MTRHDLPDDELMSRLGEVLNSEADRHQLSGDSLDRIRERVPSSSGRTTWRWAAPLAVAAAVVVGVGAAAVLVPDADQTATAPPASTLSPSPSSSTTGAPSPTPTTSDPACVGEAKVVGVYYAVDVPDVGSRLYRELLAVQVCDEPIVQSLNALFSKSPDDPDYATSWPDSMWVQSVTREGATATIDLDFVGSPVVDYQFSAASIQSIVWTATSTDTAIKRVQLLLDGGQFPSTIDTSRPLARGNSLDTLANVWILEPTQGAEVGSPVTIRVYGTGFEGNVPIKVFQNGTEVASTFVTTEMGGFAEASTTIELPPGGYEVRAYNDNGQDATLQLWDTKDFTVR